jgi:transcriptional regulator with XRE-family HTH domain
MTSDRDAPFARALRRLRGERGLSVRALAEQARYGKTYVSELELGQKPPTEAVARRLDDVLGTGGELSRLVARTEVEESPSLLEPAQDRAEPLGDHDIERLRDTIRHLVALDTLHGSEGLAGNASRTFRGTRNRLGIAGVRPHARDDLLVTLAELGEVAAWLAFDSEHQDASRRLATEAVLLAQAAGDTSMVRFLMNHLSMQAVYLGRPAEALDLAGRVLADDPHSPRVTGMMRVRRARALAQLGDPIDALRELKLAERGFDKGVGPDDPSWTWWWHAAEFARHETHIRRADGDVHGAVATSEQAVLSLPPGQGRDQAVFRADLLSDLVDARAWHDADRVAEDLAHVAAGVGSARVHRTIQRAERRAVRARAPRWLLDTIQQAATAADPAA